MGYYTRYELVKVSNPVAALETRNFVTDQEIKQEIIATSGYSDPFSDSVKWYDHETHMKKVSKAHPGITIEIAGEGEEAGDLWKKYFRDGKVQVAKAKITYDKFDPKKLV